MAEEGNAVPIIEKPEKLFREKELSQLYKTFKVQIDKVREEEEAEEKRLQEIKKQLTLRN